MALGAGLRTTGNEKEKKITWKMRLLHRLYHQRVEEVTEINKSCQRPDNDGREDNSEALIMAAQEQILSPRSIQTGCTTEEPRRRGRCDTSLHNTRSEVKTLCLLIRNRWRLSILFKATAKL